MKDGYIVKNSNINNATPDEMQLINKYSRRPLNSEEVYVFSVVLCDNDIDRDFECFTKNALQKLAELYVGKTGILDHDNDSSNQTARIFFTKVEEFPDKLTKTGETYCRLFARAYMPIIDKNKDFISEIDMGIKKEVSVGCAISKKYCSVCGADLTTGACIHDKGKYYEHDGKAKLCFVLLDEPTDAYEWSFVAVPAQPNAGVIKSMKNFTSTDISASDCISKHIKCGKEIYLNKEQSTKIGNYIRNMEELASVGKLYREKLESEIVKFCSITEPTLENDIMENICKRLDIEQIKSLHKLFSDKINHKIPNVPQLATKKQTDINDKTNNLKFKI